MNFPVFYCMPSHSHCYSFVPISLGVECTSLTGKVADKLLIQIVCEIDFTSSQPPDIHCAPEQDVELNTTSRQSVEQAAKPRHIRYTQSMTVDSVAADGVSFKCSLHFSNTTYFHAWTSPPVVKSKRLEICGNPVRPTCTWWFRPSRLLFDEYSHVLANLNGTPIILWNMRTCWSWWFSIIYSFCSQSHNWSNMVWLFISWFVLDRFQCIPVCQIRGLGVYWFVNWHTCFHLNAKKFWRADRTPYSPIVFHCRTDMDTPTNYIIHRRVDRNTMSYSFKRFNSEIDSMHVRYT